MNIVAMLIRCNSISANAYYGSALYAYGHYNWEKLIAWCISLDTELAIALLNFCGACLLGASCTLGCISSAVNILFSLHFFFLFGSWVEPNYMYWNQHLCFFFTNDVDFCIAFIPLVFIYGKKYITIWSSLLTFWIVSQLAKNGYDYKSVKRWTTRRKLGYELIDCDKVKWMLHSFVYISLAVSNLLPWLAFSHRAFWIAL